MLTDFAVMWNSQVYIAENNTINALDKLREQVMLKFSRVKRDSQFTSQKDFNDVLGAANSEPEKNALSSTPCVARTTCLKEKQVSCVELEGLRKELLE